MPIIQAVKSLNAGKFSPLLRARDEYVASCKTLKNFIPTVQGPLQRRAGTRYIADITGAVRLLPFVFSPLQRYLFVFYENKIDVMNGENVVKTLQTTYKSADIPNLFYTQVQDVMFLAHADYPMKKITRTIGANNAADFKIEDVAFKNGPYLDENITDTTISVTGTTATASTSLFSASDIGRWLHVETVDNGTTKCLDAQISAVPSATTVTLTDLNGEFHSGKATKMWRMSPFSAINGYPEAVCYHQERLWVAKAGRIYAACQAGGADFSIKKADATVLETNGFSVNMATMLLAAYATGGAGAVATGVAQEAALQTDRLNRSLQELDFWQSPTQAKIDAFDFRGNEEKRKKWEDALAAVPNPNAETDFIKFADFGAEIEKIAAMPDETKEQQGAIISKAADVLAQMMGANQNGKLEADDFAKHKDALSKIAQDKTIRADFKKAMPSLAKIEQAMAQVREATDPREKKAIRRAVADSRKKLLGAKFGLYPQKAQRILADGFSAMLTAAANGKADAADGIYRQALSDALNVMFPAFAGKQKGDLVDLGDGVVGEFVELTGITPVIKGN